MTKPLIITVFNSKGGIGKTTLTALIAQYMAGRGFATGVVDVDVQGSQTTLFQLAKQERLNAVLTRDMTAVEALTAVEPRFVPAFKGCAAGYLGVLQGGPKSKIALDAVIQAPANYELLSNLDIFAEMVVGPLADALDVMVIDLGPNDQRAAMSALVATDYLLIPTACEWLSIDRIPVTLKWVAIARRQKEVQVLGIVPTMGEYHFGRMRKSKSTQAALDHLEQNYAAFLLRDGEGLVDLPWSEDWRTSIWTGDLLFSDVPGRRVMQEAMRFLNAVGARLGLEEVQYAR